MLFNPRPRYLTSPLSSIWSCVNKTADRAKLESNPLLKVDQSAVKGSYTSSQIRLSAMAESEMCFGTALLIVLFCQTCKRLAGKIWKGFIFTFSDFFPRVRWSFGGILFLRSFGHDTLLPWPSDIPWQLKPSSFGKLYDFASSVTLMSWM